MKVVYLHLLRKSIFSKFDWTYLKIFRSEYGYDKSSCSPIQIISGSILVAFLVRAKLQIHKISKHLNNGNAQGTLIWGILFTTEIIYRKSPLPPPGTALKEPQWIIPKSRTKFWVCHPDESPPLKIEYFSWILVMLQKKKSRYPLEFLTHVTLKILI